MKHFIKVCCFLFFITYFHFFILPSYSLESSASEQRQTQSANHNSIVTATGATLLPYHVGRLSSRFGDSAQPVIRQFSSADREKAKSLLSSWLAELQIIDLHGKRYSPAELLEYIHPVELPSLRRPGKGLIYDELSGEVRKITLPPLKNKLPESILFDVEITGFSDFYRTVGNEGEEKFRRTYYLNPTVTLKELTDAQKLLYVTEEDVLSVTYSAYEYSVDFTLTREKKVMVPITARITLADGRWLERVHYLTVEIPRLPYRSKEGDYQLFDDVVKIQAPKTMLDTEKFRIEVDARHPRVYPVTLQGRALSEEEAKRFLSGEYFFPLEEHSKLYSYSIELPGFIHHGFVNVISTAVQIHIRHAAPPRNLQKFKYDVEFSCDAEEYGYGFLHEKKVEDTLLYGGYPVNEEFVEVKARAALFLRDGNLLRREDAEDSQRSGGGRRFEKEVISKVEVLENLPPAVLLEVSGKSIRKEEPVSVLAEAVSLDGDRISPPSLRYFKLVGSAWEEIGLIPTEYGKYKIVMQVQDEAEAAPLQPYVSRRIEEVVFEKKNSSPVTEVRIQSQGDTIPIDIVLFADESVPERIRNMDKVSFQNIIREKGYDVKLDIYDRTVYTDVETVKEAYSFGESIPPGTFHYEREGYRGTLRRTKYQNNPYTVSGKRKVTLHDTKFIVQREENRSGGEAVYQYRRGQWVLIRPWNGSLLPYTVSYSSDGYSGTLVKSGFEDLCDPPPSGKASENELYYRSYRFNAVYTGHVSKQVESLEPYTYLRDEYTGYYEGEVRKEYKREFSHSPRLASDKIILLCSEESARSFEAEKGYDMFRNYRLMELPFDFSPEDLIRKLQEEDPYPPDKVILVEEEVTTHVTDVDLDGDEIRPLGFSYHHQEDFFDHPTGRLPDQDVYLQNSRDSFSYPGKYQVKRQVKDLPGGLSNVASDTFLVHRKPIADFDLKWDFLEEENRFTLHFEDLSYDPDREEGGIVARSLGFEPLSSAKRGTIYTMSDGIEELPHIPEGEYRLSFAVKDFLHEWSEVVTKTFDMNRREKIQLSAKLVPKDKGFSVEKFPAGETLVVSDIRTFFSGKHALKISVNGVIVFHEESPEQRSREYLWDDISFVVPPETADGSYVVRVQAVSPSGVTSELLLPYHVDTPIWVTAEGDIAEATRIVAKTGKYTDVAQVILFYGTPFAHQATMELTTSGGQEKRYEYLCGIPEDLPDGDYEILVTVRSKSGKRAEHRHMSNWMKLRIENAEIEGKWNLWNTRRFMSYEKIKIRCTVSGNPDEVTLTPSEELTKMYYKNQKNQIYRYKEEVGYELRFPMRMQKKSEGLYECEFILPLADSTLDRHGNRLREAYRMTIRAKKGLHSAERELTGIELTENVHEMLLLQPKYRP